VYNSMLEFTRNILQFYKYNDNTSWYLKKYFTDTLHVGYYSPYATNAILNKSNGDPFLPTIDEINTYEINSLGLRGEVDLDADVLASGCSITFGIGVPEEGRWTNILSNKMNKSVMNLGNPGGSVATICKHIISYCMNNKMPKEIFCLMPDFARSMVVVDKEFYRSGVNRKDVGTGNHLQLMFCNPRIKTDGKTVVMETRDKRNIEDSVSPHQLILDAVDYIYILESFCLVNNIKLYWTTWDAPSSMVMEELSSLEDFKLKNFVPLYPKNSGDQLNIFIENTCSKDHDSEFKDHLCWPTGSDYSIIDNKKQTKMAHPGIHFQYHVAEFFYNLHSQNNAVV
jgi:hypothetical protein